MAARGSLQIRFTAIGIKYGLGSYLCKIYFNLNEKPFNIFNNQFDYGVPTDVLL